MMKKKKIGAAVCSLAFVLSISACNGAEQEILLIGGQKAEEMQSGQPRDPQGAQPRQPWDPQGTQSGQTWDPQGTQSGQPWDPQEAQGVQAWESGNGRTWPPGGSEETLSTAAEICVYVCGAVEAPGIVFLPEGSRAADALEAAGGFASGAAEDAVNLAARVSDGEKLYFPDCEEYQAQSETQAAAAAGLVNINTADAAQLCTLPGIGESRAADIIAYREACGSFASCEDIMKVSGIKESVYNKIKDRITVTK